MPGLPPPEWGMSPRLYRVLKIGAEITVPILLLVGWWVYTVRRDDPKFPRPTTILSEVHHLFFFSQLLALPDIASVLRGVARVAYAEQKYAVSILHGEECPVTSHELSLLLSIPADHWVDSDGIDSDALEQFARNGLVLTDDPETSLAEFVRRYDALQAGQWNLYAALYHFLTKLRDIDVKFELPEGADPRTLSAEMRQVLDDFVAAHGPPPPAFRPAASKVIFSPAIFSFSSSGVDPWAIVLRRLYRSRATLKASCLSSCAPAIPHHRCSHDW